MLRSRRAPEMQASRADGQQPPKQRRQIAGAGCRQPSASAGDAGSVAPTRTAIRTSPARSSIRSGNPAYAAQRSDSWPADHRRHRRKQRERRARAMPTDV